VVATLPQGEKLERVLYVAPEGETFCLLCLAPPGLLLLLTLFWSSLVTVIVATVVVALVLVRPPPPVVAERSVGWSVGWGLGLWAVAFVALLWLSPRAYPLFSPTQLAPFLSALVLALLTLAAMRTASAVAWRWESLLLGLVIALIASVGLAPTASPRFLQALSADLALMVWTFCGGALLTWGVRRPSYLVATGLVIALADIFSVYCGPAATALAVPPPAETGRPASWLALWTQASLVSFPLLGSNALIPFIGAGDFLFSALFLMAARKFHLPPGRNFAALALAFTLGLALAHFARQPLPALPFIGPAFILVHWSQIKPDRSERRKILIFCLGMTLAFAALAAIRWAQG